MDADDEAWTIVLIPLRGDAPPAAVRVRALLKRALRTWRLRCVVVRRPTPDESALAGVAGATGATDGLAGLSHGV